MNGHDISKLVLKKVKPNQGEISNLYFVILQEHEISFIAHVFGLGVRRIYKGQIR